MSRATKRVGVGIEGQTPRKQFTYNPNDSVETLSKISHPISPNNATSKSPKASPEERPKTSRKKPNPNPDEFTDYLLESDDIELKEIDEDEASRMEGDAAIRLACYLFGLSLKV